MAGRERFPLPWGWTRTVRSSVVHAASMASAALTSAWSRAAGDRRPKVRMVARLERAKTEIALLTKELCIKDARWSRVPPRRRPYYGPIHRMRILKLKAARGWSTSQVTQFLLVTEETVASWTKPADEEGERSLLQIGEPVNKFPDYVGCLVRCLKIVCPTMGKVRIAQTLARAGLQLGTTTVGRMIEEDKPEKDPGELALEEEAPPCSTGDRRAKYADHIWHVDFSTVPTASGFRVPWLPHSRPLRWPFCWWVAVVIDQFSRRVNGLALFNRPPSSAQVCDFLGGFMERTESRPRHVTIDKGSQDVTVVERSVACRFLVARELDSITILWGSAWSGRCRTICRPVNCPDHGDNRGHCNAAQSTHRDIGNSGHLSFRACLIDGRASTVRSTLLATVRCCQSGEVHPGHTAIIRRDWDLAAGLRRCT